jgi:hypothetical protein
VDLSVYKEGKLGLRWRTQAEVIGGKGQFECGNITKGKPCAATAALHSYELNFAYTEQGQRKQELVKVRACPRCAAKLNYHKQHKRSSSSSSRGDVDGKSRSAEKKRKRGSGEGRTASREGGEAEDEPSAELSAAVSGGGGDADDERGGDQDAATVGGKRANAAAEGAAEGASWTGEAPTAKSEGDEMDEYLQGLFM